MVLNLLGLKELVLNLDVLKEFVYNQKDLKEFILNQLLLNGSEFINMIVKQLHSLSSFQVFIELTTKWFFKQWLNSECDICDFVYNKFNSASLKVSIFSNWEKSYGQLPKLLYQQSWGISIFLTKIRANDGFSVWYSFPNNFLLGGPTWLLKTDSESWLNKLSWHNQNEPAVYLKFSTNWDQSWIILYRNEVTDWEWISDDCKIHQQ